MALTVPRPTLELLGEGEITGNTFPAEKPLKLKCGPVKFPDNSELVEDENKELSGFWLFREKGGGATEVWDEQNLEWVSISAQPEHSPLLYQDNIWQCVLVAIGQKDKDQNDKFGTSSDTGYPKYFFTCYFRGKDSEGTVHEGTSPPSQPVEIHKDAGESNRAGLDIEPPEEPAKATKIWLFLKDQSLEEKGTITIKQSNGEFEIELAVSGSKIVMTKDGEIEIQPKTGRNVRIHGNLSVDQINNRTVT